MVDVRNHHCGYVFRRTGMSTYRDRSGIDSTLAIDQGDIDGFLISSRVLDGQPFIIADVGVPLGKAIVARSGWPDLPQHIGSTHRGEAASIVPVDVIVLEEHLAFSHNRGP